MARTPPPEQPTLFDGPAGPIRIGRCNAPPGADIGVTDPKSGRIRWFKVNHRRGTAREVRTGNAVYVDPRARARRALS